MKDYHIEHPDITEMREKGFIDDCADVVEEKNFQHQLEAKAKKRMCSMHDFRSKCNRWWSE